MSKSKYFVIGSIVTAALSGGFFISGVSNQQVEATAVKEGYTPKAIIPVKGDVPTIGNGITVYCNGKKVTLKDPAISKEKALQQLKCHIEKNAPAFNKSLQNVKVSQAEYDLYNDFVYQYGIAAWNGSSMLRNLKQGKYVQACDSLLKWKYVAKRDCSVRSNNCYGVWTRQVERHSKCIGVQ